MGNSPAGSFLGLSDSAACSQWDANIHSSLPLPNFHQLRATAMLRNTKLELEKVRGSEKVRKNPPTHRAHTFPVGKFTFFFWWKAVKKGIFPIANFLPGEMLELQPALF